jgi:putative ABC transport system permease protein
MANKHYSPPKLAERLAGRALDEGERSVRLGDLEERYQYLVYERGERRARAWYRRQVLHLVILAIINHILWSYIMFKNNLIIAWRNIKKSKIYSMINIFGLAAGMAIFILLMLFVWNELSYDRFHEHAASIYRIDAHVSMENRELGVFSVPAPLGPALAAEFPEVIRATRLINRNAGIVTVDDRLFEEPYSLYAETSFFDVFSVSVMKGDPETMLAAPLGLVLTDETAEKWFGTVPWGKQSRLGLSRFSMSRASSKRCPPTPTSSSICSPRSRPSDRRSKPTVGEHTII